MKKQGGFIPGIRPGKPTTEYLTTVLNSIIFLGAIGMVIVCALPIFFSGAFGADVSFSGTSLIIVVGVVIETSRSNLLYWYATTKVSWVINNEVTAVE